MSHSMRASLLLLASLGGCHPLAPKPTRPFDQPPPTARISAQGAVLSVERPRPEDSQSYVHLMVAPGGKAPLRLVLAPGWYLEREGIRFTPQENVRFEGHPVVGGAEETIEVQRIEQGRRSYVLRDAKNQPAWAVTR